MLTKFVVIVASTMSAAPAQPRPIAAIILPGSALFATRAAERPRAGDLAAGPLLELREVGFCVVPHDGDFAALQELHGDFG